jgi:beta-aspartyl-peptidase (threonine type)
MLIILSSINGKVGIPTAMQVLQAGGSALDAIEAGTRVVERNVADHSVGLGGLPNLLGEVRLDAAIMDGRTLRAGAVGSVQGYVHVITLARHVMEETPHVFLVGDGAERFAREMGLTREDPSTPEAEAKWREGLLRHYPGLDLSQLAEQGNWRDMVQTLNQPMEDWEASEPHGTVNFIAQDGAGNLAAAVSTSGWPWSYPGRLGDSPVIGAGCYADNRWGAAASTGTGEVVLRTSTTRSIILYMKMGMTVSQAICEALKDLRDLQDPYVDQIALIALDRSGEHAGYSYRPNERYVYMTDTMSEPVEVDMAPVPQG